MWAPARTRAKRAPAAGAGAAEGRALDDVACSEAIDLSRHGCDVVVVVRDRGRRRPPRGEHRGRGQQLMAALMDKVETVPGDDGTEVRMVRRLGGGECGVAGKD